MSWLKRAIDEIKGSPPLPVDNMRDHRPREVRFTDRTVINEDEDGRVNSNYWASHRTRRYTRLDDGK